jgi:class 3 adenylate cyclase
MVGDIGAWLEDLGFGKYAEAFVANDVDLRALPHLTDEDLKDIGVSLGDRRVIIAAAAKLVDEPATEIAARKPTPSAQAERRQLTVMFCDLVGSTAIAEKLDPEDFGTVIRTFQETCVAAVTRFEGYVAKFLGDGILIYFGYPQAHEDDAERAVRAGLAIVDALSGVEIEQNLQARIGVATGLVVAGDMVGEGVLEQRAVLGETPNLAARLQALAEPNAVVIAPETHALVGETFEFVDLGRHTLKGFAEPVRAWRMIGTRATESRFEASRGTGHTGLVGRETEIAHLEERWRQAKAGVGQVVLVSGEAGIGKSRITQVLRERIAEEPHLRLRYQCSPYYTNSAAYPFIAQLEHAAHFDRDDDGDAKLDKLEALLTQSATGASQVVPLFAALLSLPVDRYPPLKYSPERQKRETIAALADQMVALAEQQPVLLVFEDVHWCDATSLEALSVMIDRIPNAAVLVVITYRPEFEPPWADRDHATVLALNRLSIEQGANMVIKVTGGKTLPQEVLDQIVAKTDGIPLFVEELTKTVLEAGFLKAVDDAYLLDGPLPPLAIPATLQDSLTARLDRLSPVKEIAQVGACIGREFTHELIAAVSPVRENELQDALQQLVNSELVIRHGETWTFKHALVRDAAYESLLRSRRQQLHNSIANALEDQFADQVANQPEIIAHHFTEAGLNERAVPYWHAAGARAVARTAYLEAVSHLERSLSLNAKLPPSLESDRQELDIRLLLATTYMAMFGWATKDAPDTLRAARILAHRLGETEKLVSVLNNISAYHTMICEFSNAAEVVNEIYIFARIRPRRRGSGYCMRARFDDKMLARQLRGSANTWGLFA